jgi:hypothetical protein
LQQWGYLQTVIFILQGKKHFLVDNHLPILCGNPFLSLETLFLTLQSIRLFSFYHVTTAQDIQYHESTESIKERRTLALKGKKASVRYESLREQIVFGATIYSPIDRVCTSMYQYQAFNRSIQRY